MLFSRGKIWYQGEGRYEAMTEENGNKPISDDVIIEIVHAFRDIIIEFINRRYPTAQ